MFDVMFPAAVGEKLCLVVVASRRVCPVHHRWSEKFIHFVSNCLIKSPAQRATATTLLQDPFIKEAKPHSILRVSKMLCVE